MIRRIGLIHQGPNDLGFVRGLRSRLGCGADVIPAKERGRQKFSVWKHIKSNLKFFEAQGVDIIVRLTDCNGDAWQEVKRRELEKFPVESKSRLVCGVTNRAIELWLGIDRNYLESELGIPRDEALNSAQMIGRIKNAITSKLDGRDYSRWVEHFVQRAPADVFQNWLTVDSLRDFYSDCRNMAIQDEDCRSSVNDELKS